MVTTVQPLDRSQSGSETFTIQRLLGLAESGALRVPRFQRSFVWAESDVRKLFDSLYRGFPVGTLLLWEQPAPADRVVFGGVEIDAPERQDALMVVDGQQRVTSLVATLAPRTAAVDGRFEIFFDLAKRRFVGLNRGAPPSRAIPVRETLESRALLAWLRHHGDELEDGDFELADELGGALRDYRIPAYVVKGNDERLLREVFDRVNSAGKPISRAQVFHALFANDAEPGSPATVVETLRRLGFGDIQENRVVQSLLAMRGGDVQRDLHDEFTDEEEVADWYEQTERALDRSIRFLKSVGVAHQLLMPSSFPLPVLATFFHLHPDPDPATLRLLERWLWRGWVHGFGREGGQTPSLRRAIRSINPTKGNRDDAPEEFSAVRVLLDHVRDNRVDELELKTFRTDNARARLALLAIASLRPLTPQGAPLDVAGLLREHGVDGIGMLVPGDRSQLGSRSFWLSEWGTAADVEDDVLVSHGASSETIGSLRRGDFDGFVEGRLEDVHQLTVDFLNSRLATGMRTLPPVSSLLVPDPEDELIDNG